MPGCICKHCLRHNGGGYSIHYAETKSEYKYLLLGSKKDNTKKLFIEIFPYSVKNARTDDISHAIKSCGVVHIDFSGIHYFTIACNDPVLVLHTVLYPGTFVLPVVHGQDSRYIINI